MDLPGLLVANLGDTHQPMVVGFLQPEKPIKLRLDMLLPTKITMVPGCLLCWQDVMLIVISIFFLALILAHLMIA
jgi:hypothetical protein